MAKDASIKRKELLIRCMSTSVKKRSKFLDSIMIQTKKGTSLFWSVALYCAETLMLRKVEYKKI